LVEARAIPLEAKPDTHHLSQTLDETIARRIAFLTDYQDAAYAERYADWLRRVRIAETARLPDSSALSEAVARALFKLMAYKDEYEVARLYTEGDFLKRVADRFDGPYRLRFHLAPPLLGERDSRTGHLKKREFGAWMLPVFRVLAKMRGLRGTPLDIFGEYQQMLGEVLAGLSPDNHAIAVELAALPLDIRGFGHIKDAAIKRAEAKSAALLARFRTPLSKPALAAE
jgi:indolepyruvate ferredoxin oxidoreductase